MQSIHYSCQILVKIQFFSIEFRKKAQISNFMEIRLLGSEFFHADAHTDMTKLIIAFRSFSNAPKNACFVAFCEQHCAD
jgi:hypothetical protein